MTVYFRRLLPSWAACRTALAPIFSRNDRAPDAGKAYTVETNHASQCGSSSLPSELAGRYGHVPAVGQDQATRPHAATSSG